MDSTSSSEMLSDASSTNSTSSNASSDSPVPPSPNQTRPKSQNVDMQKLVEENMIVLREKLFKYENMLRADNISEEQKTEIKAQHSKVKGVMQKMLRITMSPKTNQLNSTASVNPKQRSQSTSSDLPSPILIPRRFPSAGVGGIPGGLNLRGDPRKRWSGPFSAPGTPPNAALRLPMRTQSIPSFNVNHDNFTTADGLSMSPGPTRMMQDGRAFVASLQDFKKVHPIGKGAHGEVWKVVSETVKVGEAMAMKEIPLGDASQKKVDRIVRELQVLKKARGNPYIVELHGQFYDKQMFSIIMEFMNAGSLEGLLKIHVEKFSCGLPEHVIAHVTRATMRGLSFLYDEMQVMHRDVKPSNILASLDGRVKICDFGICADLGLQNSVTSYIGTLYYMSPERIVPQQDKSYGPTVDIWGMGVTIVELAIGHYPYPRDEKVFEMLHHIVTGSTAAEREPFASMRFEEEHISDFCTSCLQKKPENRPSYSEVLEHPFLDLDDDSREVVREWLCSIGLSANDKNQPSSATRDALRDAEMTPRPTQDFDSDGLFDTAIESTAVDDPRERINTF
eukprot:m.95521 g.95521  ORF g.95521 m.95521 type:complete len:564 (-) comp26826_c0_seq1:96-1787(-)